ncbi:MAG: sulfatase [Phycisphaerae bacterium]|nr:sulfatase [Phycisphaerae bacterium]
MLGGLAFAASAGQAAASNIPAKRPNVLLLHCHDLGTYLHCYGVKTVRTPNLDRLASEGVRFERSFCTAPQCSPSRASIFTGRYPHNNGVMGLCHADFAWDLHPDERHLGQILADAGYATAGVGVIHETHGGPKRCGLQRYEGGGKAKQVVDKTIGLLEESARRTDKPFYIQAGCIEPHRLGGEDPKASDHMGFLGTHLRPDDSLGVSVPGFLRDTEGTRTELAELQGAVRHMDEQYGRLLEAVDRLGLRQDTLVIFTTDHGYAMPRAKCSLYDPGLAVALMLRLPSRKGWHGGGVHSHLVSNVDYLPTILDLLGIPVPENVQGRSLAALLDGRAYEPRKEVFGEITYHDYYDPRRCIRTETHKLIVNFSSAPAFMDPSQSWRPRSDTVEPPNHALAYHPVAELYDLRNDPWEQKDLAKDPAHATVRKELLTRLHRHLSETQDPILTEAVVSPMHRKAWAALKGGRG